MQHKNQGTAIFMALLMIAIVATIAMFLVRTQHMHIRRTQMMMTSEQAYLYADAVLDWAITSLLTDLSNPIPPTAWPLVLPPTVIADGQGSASGLLQDAQALFNINNLGNINIPNEKTNPNESNAESKLKRAQTSVQGATNKENEKNKQVFLNLLTALKVSEQDQQNLLAAIVDWLSIPPPGNENNFDQYYAGLQPPYRSPHTLMRSISELRTIRGMTPNLYNLLLPYLIALPEQTALIPEHAAPLIQQAMEWKAEKTNKPPAQSKYFLLRADVYLQDQHLVVYWLLERWLQDNKNKIKLVWKSLGTI